MVLCGCDVQIERDPSVLVQSTMADVATLNPLTYVEYNAFLINQYVYETLIDWDMDTFEPKPVLATRWEVSDDHLTYTFWIRKGVHWQDGEPLTIDDVIYSFEQIQNPKVDAAKLRNYFVDVEKIEKVGDDAVRFVYRIPYFKAFQIIGSMSVIPKHIFDNGEDINKHSAGRSPIGSGPYRFVSWTTGRQIELERFDGYWGEKSDIKGITYKVIPNNVTKLMLLKKGALDFSGLSPVQWDRQTDSASFAEHFTKHKYYLPTSSFISWNNKRTYFSDKRVRIAMTMLMNRKEIVDKVMFGQGELTNNDFYRFGRNYDESIAPYPYDPDGAAKLLDEAGWQDHDGDGIRDKDGVPFKFAFLVNSGGTLGISIGLFLREELMKQGIVMEISQVEWATLQGIMSRRDFDAVVSGLAGSFDEDPFQNWHSSQVENGMNYIGFVNKEADRLLKEARTEFDDAKRKILYQRFQQILHEEEPCTFLFTNPTLIAVGKRFEDVVVHKAGIVIPEWKVGPSPVLMEW